MIATAVGDKYMRKWAGTAKWPVILLLVLSVVACAPLKRSRVESASALVPSSDRFWRHVDSAGGHDWFHLLNSYEEAMQWRLTMIDSAHHAIDLETFLWKGDTGGLRVLSHLLAAADRGVRVRMLLDDSFTPHQDLLLYTIDSHPNIELRIYNPYRIRSGDVVGRTLFNISDFQRVNHRLHNKTLVVDGWVANVGGRNLADEYFGLHDEYNFRDMEVLTMGDSVQHVSQHFADFWNSAWSFPVEEVAVTATGGADLAALRRNLEDEVGSARVASESQLEQQWLEAAGRAVSGRAHFVADKPAGENPALASEAPNQLADYLLQRIAEAQREVVMVSAYLVPTRELSDAIEQCTARGVRVRMLTNSLRSNNHLAAHAAYSKYIQGLVASGVELFELRTDAADRNLYMAGPVKDKRLGLHAKFMLLDGDRVFIGSSNLDPRSLQLNTEVGLMIESRELNRLLRKSIDVDFLPRNAWSVQLDDRGKLSWVGDGEVRSMPPADSPFQQLGDWFIGLLPVDAAM